MTNIVTPPQIIERISELNRISADNPISMPISEIANFLDCDVDSVRAYLENSPYPFGMAWKKSKTANRAFKIPTLKFYLWNTNGVIFRNPS